MTPSSSTEPCINRKARDDKRQEQVRSIITGFQTGSGHTTFLHKCHKYHTFCHVLFKHVHLCHKYHTCDVCHKYHTCCHRYHTFCHDNSSWGIPALL